MLTDFTSHVFTMAFILAAAHLNFILGGVRSHVPHYHQ
jgi:hypothetical protein